MLKPAPPRPTATRRRLALPPDRNVRNDSLKDIAGSSSSGIKRLAPRGSCCQRATMLQQMVAIAAPCTMPTSLVYSKDRSRTPKQSEARIIPTRIIT